ncbi:RNA polymerase sigma factor [Croceiramulus getboli]|nr:RNA polymerase sigma factor [Flavobacteriaceae bacterium YJPT1-3]
MNQKTFITLIDPFQDKMYRLARRLLVSEDEAQDAVQEVVLKLWTKRETLKKYRSVEALAMTMTKNYSYDKLKAKSSSNLKIVHSNYEDNNSNTRKQVEVNDDVNSVFELMKELPEQQQLILQLRDVEQYDNAEIAKMLEMNETAVRVSLSRARKSIREALIKKHNYGIG